MQHSQRTITQRNDILLQGSDERQTQVPLHEFSVGVMWLVDCLGEGFWWTNGREGGSASLLLFHQVRISLMEFIAA